MAESERHDVNETKRQRKGREKAHDRTERGKSRRDIILVACLLVFLFGAERFIDHRNRGDARQAIIEGIEANCNNDHDLRVEYRDRGRLDKAVADFLLDVAKQNIGAGVDENGLSRDFIIEIRPLANEVEILPVPDCELERAKIEAALD